jgi:hypothetical protein
LLDDDVTYNNTKNELIDYMINSKLIAELIGDKFGNYVVQKALQVSDGMRFLAIIHVVYN